MDVFNLINHAVHLHHKEHPMEFIQQTLRNQSRYIHQRRHHLLNKIKSYPEWTDLKTQDERHKFMTRFGAKKIMIVWFNYLIEQKEAEQLKWIEIRTRLRSE
eukprot:UN10324